MKETNRFRCDKRVHKSHNSIGIPIPTHMTRPRTERELQTGINTIWQAGPKPASPPCRGTRLLTGSQGGAALRTGRPRASEEEVDAYVGTIQHRIEENNNEISTD